MKLEFSQQVFEKYTNIKVHNPSRWRPSCSTRTDRWKNRRTDGRIDGQTWRS